MPLSFDPRWKQWKVALLLSTGLALIPQPLCAQSIISSGARTLFNRATLVRSSVEIGTFSIEEDGKSVKITQYVPSVAVVYGFYPKWTVIAAQPYVSTSLTTREAGNPLQRISSSGLADTRIFVQYDGLYSRNAPGGLTRLSGIFGLQVPSGADRFSTGAVEYTGGLIFEKAVRLKYVFTGDFEYTVATENKRRISVGDRARFDAALGRFILSGEKPPDEASWWRRSWHRVFRHGAYAILELNGVWQDHGRDQDKQVPNIGGTTLSVSPGIQYFVNDSFLAEFSAPIPAVRELNGMQPKPGTTFVVGFRYLF